jgi:hypothetical protein
LPILAQVLLDQELTAQSFPRVSASQMMPSLSSIAVYADSSRHFGEDTLTSQLAQTASRSGVHSTSETELLKVMACPVKLMDRNLVETA